MKISVITVSHNSEATIERAMVSVLVQKDILLEYIIIDGNSSDGTVDIIKKYHAMYPDTIKWISEADCGIYDAMNKGLKLATGDIIGILNSDDQYSSVDVLSSVHSCFEKSDIDCCYGNILYIKDNRPYRYWISGRSRKFYFGWMPPHPAVFIKKSVYEKFGEFRLDCGTAADYELMFRFMHKEQIKSQWIKKTFVYMQHGGASSVNLTAYHNSSKNDKKAWIFNGYKVPFMISFNKRFRKLSQFAKAWARLICRISSGYRNYYVKLENPKVSASVVLDNMSRENADAMVQSMIDCDSLKKIYIADNRGSDEYSKYLMDTDRIEYISHEGTESGHNIAMHKAADSGMDFHLVLPSDVVVKDGDITALSDCVNDAPDAVAVIPDVVGSDGESLLGRYVLPGSSCLFRRVPSGTRMLLVRLDLLRHDDIWYDENLTPCFEEYDFVHHLCKAGKVLFCSDVAVTSCNDGKGYGADTRGYCDSAVRYLNRYGWFMDRDRNAFNKQIRLRLSDNK